MKPKITFHKISNKLVVEVPPPSKHLPPEILTMEARSGGWIYNPPMSGVAQSLPTGKWLITEDPRGRRNYFALFYSDPNVNDQFIHNGAWRNGIRFGFHERAGSHGCIMTMPSTKDTSQGTKDAARRTWTRIQELVRAASPQNIQYVNNSDPNRSDPTVQTIKAYFFMEVKL